MDMYRAKQLAQEVTGLGTNIKQKKREMKEYMETGMQEITTVLYKLQTIIKIISQ